MFCGLKPCMHAVRFPRAPPPLRRPAAAAASPAAAARARPSALRVTAGYQRPLTNQERKAKRAEAQRLGRSLVTVQVGQKGLTEAFMDGLRAALLANELVKVKVGAADESLEEVAEAVQAACDCVLVHKIGFTLTLYRERGLPPVGRCAGASASAEAAAAAAARGGAAASSGIISVGGVVRAGGGGDGPAGDAGSDVECEDGEELPEDVEAIDEELAAYLMEDEDAFSDSDSEGEEEGGGGGAAQRGRKPPPPEFTIIG